MKKIILNGIEFNVTHLEEYKENEKLIVECTILSTGDREFHLIKQILSGKKITYGDIGNETEMRVKNYSYQKLKELSTDGEVKFKVKLIQKTKDEPSAIASVASELFFIEQRIGALISLLEEKGILNKGEFEGKFSSYLKSIDAKKEVSDYIERLLGITVDFNEFNK